MKRLVVIDNDGGVDDAWAIFMMMNDPNVEILALSCVFGNTSLENVCNNNLRLVAQFDRTDIPVFRGANSPLIARDSESPLPNGFQYFHGRNGFGDVQLDDLLNTPPLQPESAYSALASIARKRKGEITLVCLGPLTNIALTIRAFPDFTENIKDVYIMGGNYTAQGNSTKRPEFNIHVDPEAADIVFRSLGGKCTLLPWEACRGTQINLAWKEKLEIDCGPSMRFLHRIEAPLTSKKKAMGFENFVSSDVLLAAILWNDEAITSVAFHRLGVELAGNYTRGQLVVLDHLDGGQGQLTKIVQTVSAEKYMDILQSLRHL